MTEKLKQTIKEEVNKLPKELQEVIAGFDWIQKTEEIGKKYSLAEENIHNLEVETLIFIIGLISKESYRQNLEKALNLDSNEIKEIAKEMDDKIFSPIYNTLTEKIKKDFLNKKTSWLQNLYFILSGGNYTFFLENKINSNQIEIPKTTINDPYREKVDENELTDNFTI